MRAALIFFLAVTAAHAEDSYARERAACQADVKLLCSHIGRGDLLAIAGCLTTNKARLSRKCRDVIAAHGL